MDIPKSVDTIIRQLDAAAGDYHNKLRALQNDPHDPSRKANKEEIKQCIDAIHNIHRERNALISAYK
jgi:hypothetical protein